MNLVINKNILAISFILFLGLNVVSQNKTDINLDQYKKYLLANDSLSEKIESIKYKIENEKISVEEVKKEEHEVNGTVK